MQQELETLKDWINHSDNIVFFGGAGVSTESGIPDFRSVDGLYNQQYDYPPETILSHTFFTLRDPLALQHISGIVKCAAFLAIIAMYAAMKFIDHLAARRRMKTINILSYNCL